MNLEEFRAIGGVVYNRDGRWHAFIKGKNGNVSADTTGKVLVAASQYLLGAAIKQQHYYDGIDLSDEAIHTVDGWKDAGGVIYRKNGLFWAFIPKKSGEKSGATELEAVTNAIVGIVERRAQVNQKNKRDEFGNSIAAKGFSKASRWGGKMFRG